MQSGDGWTFCAAGHRHWGLCGAAGLLIHDGDRVILQHRAPWTHEGGSWGIPGGARNPGETAVQAAIREAGEEAGLFTDDVEPVGLYVADHGGWSYITVVARPRRPLSPRARNAESVTVEWVPLDDVADLVLHSGFAEAWPALRTVPDRLLLVVGPEVGDEGVLAEISAEGLPAERLPSGVASGGLHRLLVDIRRVQSRVEAAQLMAEFPLDGMALAVFEPSDLDLIR